MTKGCNYKYYNYRVHLLETGDVHLFKNAWAIESLLQIGKTSLFAIINGNKIKKLGDVFIDRIHVKIGYDLDGGDYCYDITENQKEELYDNSYIQNPNYIFHELYNFNDNYNQVFVLSDN